METHTADSGHIMLAFSQEAAAGLVTEHDLLVRVIPPTEFEERYPNVLSLLRAIKTEREL